MKWFVKALNQYADFKGRAGREEYWMFFLFNILASFAMGVIGFGIMMVTEKAGAVLLPYLFMFAVLIPGWAVMVRRLHDTGRSAWFFLAVLLPVVGGIWLLIMLISKGNPDENRYGMNPVAAKQTRYSRMRSVSVALMLASVFWLLSQVIILFVRSGAVNNLMLFSLLLPVGLIITGFILFSKRKFSTDIGWSLLIIAVVWLLRDILMIRNLSSYLALSFNIYLVIEMFNVLVPVGLLLSGIYIVFKRTDRTIPACFLFVGSCVWILSIILRIMQFSFNLNDVSNILMLIPDMMAITVPVSLMVLARTLLSKNIASKESKNEQMEPVTESVKEIRQIEHSEFVQVAAQPEQPEQHQPQPQLQQPQPQPQQPQPEQPQPQPSKQLPQPQQPPVQKPSTVDDYRKRIIFLREDKDGDNVWVVYKAPTKKDAMAFLSRQRIARPSYFIVVETPEGNFGRDKDGFYQE